MQQQKDSSVIGFGGVGLFKADEKEQKIKKFLDALQPQAYALHLEKFLEHHKNGINLTHGNYSKNIPVEELKEFIEDEDNKDDLFLIYFESLLIKLWQPHLQQHYSGKLFDLFVNA